MKSFAVIATGFLRRSKVDTDASAAVYSRQLMEHAALAEKPVRLPNPDLTARAVSVICGSVVTADLNVQNGKVVDFGFEVEACALTKTVVAIMRRAVIGKTRDEISRAGKQLEALLAGEESVPSGDWAELAILSPVRDYKARHNAILLPFVAIERAFSSKKQ